MLPKGIYRLYDLTQKRIIHSRDVWLNEIARECSQATPYVAESDYKLIVESPAVPDHAYESQSPIDTDHDQQPNPAELRRSTRERKKPNFYGQEYCNICEVPKSYQEAAVGPDKK